MDSRVTTLPTPWRPIVVCGLVALVIPILYYGHLYSTARSAWLTPSPFQHPEVGRFWIVMRRAFLGTFVGEVLVSGALAVLTCWIVHVRRTISIRRIGTLVIADVSLLLAFLIAPWLVPAVGSLRLPRGNPIDGWVMGGLWPQVLPCLAATSAGVTFFFWSRHLEESVKPA
jgi:hypothetical protein